MATPVELIKKLHEYQNLADAAQKTRHQKAMRDPATIRKINDDAKRSRTQLIQMCDGNPLAQALLGQLIGNLT